MNIISVWINSLSEGLKRRDLVALMIEEAKAQIRGFEMLSSGSADFKVKKVHHKLSLLKRQKPPKRPK